MIHFACPQCRAKLKAENDKIGRLTRCPRCRSPIEVPRSLGELVPSDRSNQACYEVVELDAPELEAAPVPAVLEPAGLPDSSSSVWEPAFPTQHSKARPLFLSLTIVGLFCAVVIGLIAIAVAKQNSTKKAEEVAHIAKRTRQEPINEAAKIQRPEPLVREPVVREPVPDATVPPREHVPLPPAPFNNAMPEPKPAIPQLEKEPDKDLPELIKGELLAVKPLGQKRWRLAIESPAGQTEFTVNRRTMVYRLSPRNLALFAKSDRIEEIVQDSKNYRTSLVELDEAGADVVLNLLNQQHTRTTKRQSESESEMQGSLGVTGTSKVKGTKRQGESELEMQGSLGVTGTSKAKIKDQSVSRTGNAVGLRSGQEREFYHQEEERQERYGDPVTVAAGQQVMIFAKRTADDTLMVLVLPEPTKTKAMVELEREQAAEQAAKNYLDLQKRLIADGKIDVARTNLKNFPDRYPNTKAALEAKKLLESLD
jgi:hypothetical protein